MGGPNATLSIPGVDQAAFVLLKGDVATLSHWEGERARITADIEAKIAAIRAESQDELNVINQEVTSARERITTTFLKDVLPHANSVDDIKTITFESGVITWHKASQPTLEIDGDGSVFLRSARKHRVLRRVAEQLWVVRKEWAKAFLAKNPGLLRTLEGVRLFHSLTLSTETPFGKTALYKTDGAQETLL